MKHNYLLQSGAIVVGFMLVMILQVTLRTSVNAQGCGTLFLSGGAQSGGYASGGDAKYVPTASTDTMHISANWNMISVPRIVEDYTTSGLFPSATSKAFWYNNSYVVKTVLKNGEGYWLKFPSAQDIPISGYELTTIIIPVVEGWNMIGCGCKSVDVRTVCTDEYYCEIESPFYGYDNGYHVADTLLPGKGYWVKVDSACNLILLPPGSGGLAKESSKKYWPIKIGTSKELPPPPPDGSASTASGIPKEYCLEQAYPNPFNPITIINYQLPTDNWVTIKVYNVLGEEVMTLVDGRQDAGYKSVKWNASSIPSGMYFYRMTVGSFVDVKKMLLLK